MIKNIVSLVNLCYVDTGKCNCPTMEIDIFTPIFFLGNTVGASSTIYPSISVLSD
jgi:Ni,Fe-hydrogenase III small subunit